MTKGFLIKKLDMTQKYNEEGEIMPVTCCQASPCIVIGLKDKNGLRVQLAAGQKRRANKPLKGLMKKAKMDKPPEVIKEFDWLGEDKPKVGQKIKVSDVFEPKNKVNVIGKSKGRGFTGVVKRWNFRTQPRTHGQKQRWRAPGSIGAQTPGRVIKGKKMPGHHGNERVTVQNLTVVDVDEEKGKIFIKGGIPGPRGGWLQVVKND